MVTRPGFPSKVGRGLPTPLATGLETPPKPGTFLRTCARATEKEALFFPPEDHTRKAGCC